MIGRKPLRDQAYQEILERVHRGDLAPGYPGEGHLARRLSWGLAVPRFAKPCSGCPGRESWQPISAEASASAAGCHGNAGERRHPQRLEVLALQTSADIHARAAGPAERDRSRAGLDPKRRGPTVGLDEEWHRTLLDGCPNLRLRDMIDISGRCPDGISELTSGRPAG